MQNMLIVLPQIERKYSYSFNIEGDMSSALTIMLTQLLKYLTNQRRPYNSNIFIGNKREIYNL